MASSLGKAVFIKFILLYGISLAVEKDALEQCIDTDMFGVSDRNMIPDEQITASSATPKREGYNGRLFENGVWQASSNNYNQYLQINLGQRRLITSVATQGYRGSGQFVIDYYITYSNDDSTYIAMVNELGEPRVFPGNTHDDKPQFNIFDYPIVAQYVRFVPRRWNINIAMRVELYGCAYEGESVYFDGNSWISFNAHEPNTLYTTVDMLRFRMKTEATEGVIFYGSGNQGDHICLELRYGRLYVDVNLGSLSWSASGVNDVAGSLLDDNQWHDVELIREYKNITVSVDRVPYNITVQGEFERLDLDRFLYVGAVPTFYQPGIQARKNFIGCIESFVWNGIHMTRDKDLAPRFEVKGNVGSKCKMGTELKPMTLPDTVSYIKYTAATITPNSMELKIDFRTYDNDRLLVWNSNKNGFNFFLTIGQEGYIEMELTPSANSYTVKEIARSNYHGGSYADGLWHKLQFKASKNSIIMDIDGKEFVTTRPLTFDAGTDFYIGGGHPEKIGFVGCVRGIFIQFESENSGYLECRDGLQDNTICTGVQRDTCGMEDRCRPNPCEHGSNCKQTYAGFTCDCSNTGYKGATCHQPVHPVSCSRVYELRSRERGDIQTFIDIDGAGSLTPFEVICRYNQDTGMVETELYHDSTHEVLVDGSQAPGSYRRPIKYSTNLTQIDQLVHRASSCQQHIKYRCESSQLLEGPDKTDKPSTDEKEDGTGKEIGQAYEAYGWWIGRNNQYNYYWGGAAPGTNKCACGLDGSCIKNKPKCNCDAGLSKEQAEQISDGGFLRHKNHLPVLELRFGDTGSLYDTKRGWHTLGPLICSGDRLFDQPITFTKLDSVVIFDTFWSRNAWELKTWDISLRFKTTAESGVMVHRKGEADFIELKLVTSTSISFRFSAGYGIQAVVVDTAFQLNDNEWHTVYAERNRIQALLQVDEYAPARVPHPRGVGYLPFQFTTNLTVGASVDFKDGFVGCMGSLQVNGETLDLYEKVSNNKIFEYGITKGCVGKCNPNPCLNGGKCKEKYNEFICDCSYTPFRGLICGREVGVSIYEGQMLQYKPPVEVRTVSEKITVGFFTRQKKGVILQLTDSLQSPTEYMVVEMNSQGGIRVHFKFGIERLQVNSKMPLDIDFANGQAHIISFQRLDNGKRMRLQVDDYEPITEEDLSKLFPSGADVYLNVKYILVGRNTSSGSEFVGCIFRAEFDNHWPIKRVFQEPRPTNVFVRPNFTSVREERCGFEEILPEAQPIEIRPTYEPPIPSDFQDITVEEQSTGQNALYLGLIFGVVAIILIVIVSVVVYKCRSSGSVYSDSEEDELEMLDIGQDDDEEEEVDVYNPRSSSERKYKVKASPSGQAFI